MRGFSWVCVVLAVTGLGSLVSPGRVEAGVLRLNMAGLTGFMTTTPNGFVGYGTPWSLAADFDTASVGILPGLTSYGAPAFNVKVVVGGTTYTTTDNVRVILSLSGNPMPGILGPSAPSGISAFYNTVTPSNWDPSAPTPVVFGLFSGFFENGLGLNSSNGSLFLDSQFSSNSASITSASSPAVPEPSLVSLAIGGAAFGLVALRRRARRG
jgi:hypothetical protein